MNKIDKILLSLATNPNIIIKKILRARLSREINDYLKYDKRTNNGDYRDK